MREKQKIRPVDRDSDNVDNLKKSLKFEGGKLIVEDKFSILTKSGVLFHELSALSHLLLSSDISDFIALINAVIDRVSDHEAVELETIEPKEECQETSPQKNIIVFDTVSELEADEVHQKGINEGPHEALPQKRIQLSTWFINLMVLPIWGSAYTYYVFKIFKVVCTDCDTPPLNLIQNIFSSTSRDGYQEKFILLMQLLIGYREDYNNDDVELNQFFKFFYSRRHQYSCVDRCLLENNHAEILSYALEKASYLEESKERLYKVLRFIEKSTSINLNEEGRADLFPKLITIMDFVLLKKYDDIIDFDNLEINEEESKYPLKVVNCIYNRLTSKDHSNDITTAVTPI